jgi:hypothetical protein
VPTYDLTDDAERDLRALTPEQRRAFRRAVSKFVADLKRGGFRASLRVKRVEGYPGVWEMTWAPDGRATFHYGPEVHPGDPHVVWRRAGTHAIFRKP